ncbi:MAG: hypothetical protein EOO51_07570 [Flavobacterium sp.]|nr:MAG: hypothetical protein EOO51_07570 [Flavobacterium sp.]
MKSTTLRTAALLVLFGAMSLSCSDDNDKDTNNTAKTVEYRVLTDSPIITSVMFRNTDGEMEEGFTGDNPAEWIGALDVEPPYNAHLVASFDNTNPATVAGTISIYVDDELVNVTPVSVPPNAMQTAIADFNVE